MASDTTQNSERFQTVVTVLIAIVSTAIALVASQAAVVIGNTTEALHNGVLAKINQERVDGGSRVEINRNLREYDSYRLNSRLSTITRTYASDAESAGNTNYAIRLRLEAASLREESDLSYAAMDTYYLTQDDAGNDTGFDAQRFIADGRQSAEVGQHLDMQYEDNFAEAGRLRSEALALSVGIIVLFVSVMFLTWAQISKSMLHWVWLGAGLLIALGVGAAFLVAGALGWL